MANNFQLNVKAIIDSVDLQEQIKKIKIDPIKIQIDMNGKAGGTASVVGGISGIQSSAQSASAAVGNLGEKFTEVFVDGQLVKNISQINAGLYKTETTTNHLNASGEIVSSTFKKVSDDIKLQDKISANAAAMNTLRIRISGLTEEQNKLSNASKRYAEIDKLTDPIEKGKAIRALTTDMNAASRGINTFAATLQYMTERFIQIGMYVAIFRKLTSAISDMIETVSSLDKSLVELRKVTDMTDSQLESFTKAAFEVGEVVARTGKEVIDATATFSRAGYELQDALDLGKSALLLVNTADGINDVAEASGTLISALKAFNMEASQATHIVDALNEVSNNYAVDTDNLADILRRVSGTLSQTGTTMEEVFGLAVGGFTTLRDAEMVASGLNMISQRMRGMKEDGEAIEGLIPKIESALQKYTNGAVTMLDKQTGELRSTYDVLNDLAKIYPKLTSSQKAYLNEAIAGDDTTLYVQKCA